MPRYKFGRITRIKSTPTNDNSIARIEIRSMHIKGIIVIARRCYCSQIRLISQLLKHYPVVCVLDKVQSDHSYMVLITCKKCGELDYLTSKAFSNITDFSYKCRSCGTINRITLEEGELKKQVMNQDFLYTMLTK
jgi:hypothetical protein